MSPSSSLGVLSSAVALRRQLIVYIAPDVARQRQLIDWRPAVDAQTPGDCHPAAVLQALEAPQPHAERHFRLRRSRTDGRIQSVVVRR